MYKFKKCCVWIVCLVLFINLFVPLKVQAVTKNEVEKFISMIEQSDTINVYSIFSSKAGKKYSKKFRKDISNYLKDENKIFEMFKLYDLKNPDIWANFYIAEGYCILDKKETAYDYYTKAIDILNKNKIKDSKSYILFRQRAWCLFEMREKYRNKAIKNACNDIEEAIKFNPNDWLTFYYAGNISWFSLYYEESLAIDLLKYSKSLCEKTETKDTIQKEIKKISFVWFVKGLFSIILLLIVIFTGGGGEEGIDVTEMELADITKNFKNFIKNNVPNLNKN